jgi:anti-repressor protein
MVMQPIVERGKQNMAKKKKQLVVKTSRQEVLQKDWVFADKGEVFTDTLTVALVFGKEHKAVLRDVRNLLKTADEFGQRNFVPFTYFSEQNKELPKYLLTEDGFTLLVMGYTGSTALQFKIEYIKRFRQMKEELTAKLPGSVKQYLALSENERAIQFFQQRLALDGAKKELKDAKPKVEFHDKFVETEGLQTVNEVSKVLGSGLVRFYGWLRDEEIVQQNNKPYQKYINRGYFQLKEHVDKNGYKNSVTTTLVTPKGVSWLAKRYLEAGCPAN